MLGVSRTGPLSEAVDRAEDGVARAPDGHAEPAGTELGLERTRPAEKTRVASAQPDDAERRAWAVLMSAHGLGPVGFSSLLGRHGSAEAVLALARRPGGQGELTRVPTRDDPGAARRGLLGPGVAAAIADVAARSAEITDRIAALGLAIVTLDDPDYPARLLAVELPPPVLFVRGSLPALSQPHAVAIVGTRRPTEGGRRIASRIAAAISRSGGVVVSGLAVGIDGAAHAAAVAEQAPTVAVLGGGHAQLFPQAHRRLADAIVAAGGAVIAELPPDTSPTPGTFPRRNRLISGLADASVVVEAGIGSGALITADWALEQGRECFIVPGGIDAPMSAGCLWFLWSYPGQARIVAGVPELLADLGLAGDDSAARAAVTEVALAELGAVERSLVDRLRIGPATVDELVGASGLAVATVLGGLTLLEIRGLVSGAYGRYHLAGRLTGL